MATHLYVPAFSVPALYSVRVDDDSSLRVTVTSGRFDSILSPFGLYQSMCLATPKTERKQRADKTVIERDKLLIRAAGEFTKKRLQGNLFLNAQIWPRAPDFLFGANIDSHYSAELQ